MMLSIPCKRCGRRIVVEDLKTFYCPECKVLVQRAQGREYSRRRYGYEKVYVNCKSRLLEEEIRV